MATRDLEAAIAAFDEGNFDVLLSTNIINHSRYAERQHNYNSSLGHVRLGPVVSASRSRWAIEDPRVCLLNAATQSTSTQTAERRLEVMQTLDSLGAGFSLASHDLDIRGAGNLLGEEQSGHIREVMPNSINKCWKRRLPKPATCKTIPGLIRMEPADQHWIASTYSGQLCRRPWHPDGLYRRLAHLTAREEIDVFAAELIDRFGLPKEAENLLQVVTLKADARKPGWRRSMQGPRARWWASVTTTSLIQQASLNFSPNKPVRRNYA